MSVPIEWYLILSALLFSIGMLGVLVRRNILVMFMSVEMMLNAVNISLIAFGRSLDSLAGQAFVVFIITVAAAEAAVGLGLIVLLARHKDSVDVQDVHALKQ